MTPVETSTYISHGCRRCRYKATVEGVDRRRTITKRTDDEERDGALAVELEPRFGNYATALTCNGSGIAQ